MSPSHTRSRSVLPFVVAALLTASPAGAHPLGNDSVTHFNVLYLLPDRLEADLVLDIAETQSAIIRREEIDADKDGEDTAEEQKAWLERKTTDFARSLRVTIDGQPLSLEPIVPKTDPETGHPSTSRLILKMPGFAGMPTYRLLIRYAGLYPQALAPGQHTLIFEDVTYAQFAGLRRIILERTQGVEMIGPRPRFWDEGPDPFIYEQYDPVNLPQERKATVTFRLVGPPVGTAPAAVEPTPPDQHPKEAVRAPAPQPAYMKSLVDPRNDPSRLSKYQRQAERVVGLLQGEWGLLVLVTVTALSFGWGAAHALMPGHAKTVVAAYLISQRGTYWQAVLLAVIVTITHTALVVCLGLVIWYCQARNPTLGPQLQLWLGIIAGLLVAGMGLTLVWRAVSGRLAHQHHGHHHEGHHEHGHGHGRGHDHVHAPGDRLSVRMLLVLGITGGIVPCPTATIIMLLGIGANVVLGALYAIGVFSLGLALTLMAIGSLALSSRRFAARIMSDSQREGELSGAGRRLLMQWIPAASGLVVVALGCAIATHYLYFMRTGRALFQWIG